MQAGAYEVVPSRSRTLAIDDSRKALEIWRGPGAVFHTAEYAAALPGVLVKAGRARETREVMDSLDRILADTDEGAFASECERIRGIIEAPDGSVDEAERWLDRSIATAQSQAARLLELRATTDWATVVSTKGQTKEARERLAQISSTFSEWSTAPDVIAARITE